jgi:DGQHR domain-containing protein
MADKGAKLNKRVWRLFENAGFTTTPNSQNPQEEVIDIGRGNKRTVDLSALETHLGVKIIGWNKARNDFTESFTVHLHDYEKLKGITKADTVLFVSTDKEIQPQHKDLASSNGMNVWGRDELEYFEALVDAIGPFAKYEIINSLGLSTNEEKTIHNILALKVHQPLWDSTTELFLFTATPELLLKTCAVLRKARGDKDAYQRILQKKRLAQIWKFVTQKDALLPTNIIVNFGNNVRWESLETPSKDAQGRRITLARRSNSELVLLNLPTEYASLELIDGQHRLYGFVHTEPATQKNFNLVVLGIANIDASKRTDTFVAINDNAKRMDANLVAYLQLNEDEDACRLDNKLMAIKVVVALANIPPFKGRIRLLDVGEQRITLKGFAGYDLKGLVGDRGLLRKYYTNQSREYIVAFRMYFGVLKSMFPIQWDNPDKYIIFTNRGISAFLKLLKSILKTHRDRLDPKTIKKYLEPLKCKWPIRRWETTLLRNSYVGSKGWKDFHRDLVKTVKSIHRDFKE